MFLAGMILLTILGTLHFWFSRNAARYLETIVSEQSNGRLHLKVKGFSYNLLTGFIDIEKGSIRSFDSLSQPATYDIRLERLTLHLQSFWPLLLQRKLLLDSVQVQRPHITIYRWRKDPALATRRGEVSLPSELGRLYQSLLEGLDALQLQRIQIRQASLVLYDKMGRINAPVALKGIDFNLYYPAGLSSKGARTKGKKATLHIPAQQVNLPNGHYQLAFRQIKLEEFGSRLLLDSCTILTRNQPGIRTRFNLYFESILLSGMDFNALYRYNLIKADSVFCTSPMFRMHIRKKELAPQTRSGAGPQAQEVISNLIDDIDADLDLNFIGIRDAGFQLKLAGTKQRTISNTGHDDFTMRHLRINADSSQPFTIGQFDMMVRGYELYNEDSSAVFRFDSVQFRNNRILLRQFTATTLPGRRLPHNERRYSIPYFELEAIDWYALAFEERLRASNAYLINPDIYFRAIKPKNTRRKQSLFDLLETAGGMLSLDKVHVRNGQLHLVPNDHTDIRLSNAYLVLRTPSLLAARNETGLKNSVEELAFDRGIVRQENATLQFHDVRYLENGSLQAQGMELHNKVMDAHLQSVSLGNAFIDPANRRVTLQDLGWAEGMIHLQALGNKENNTPGTTLLINQIYGRNTRLLFNNNGIRISCLLQSLRAASVAKEATGALQVAGPQWAGSDLSVQFQSTKLAATGFSLDDKSNFALRNITLEQFGATDSIQLQVPLVWGSIDLEKLLQKKISINQLQLAHPNLWMRKRLSPENTHTAASPKNDISIGQIELLQPQLDIAFSRQEDTITQLRMARTAKGRLQMNDFQTARDSLSIGRLQLHTGPMWLQKKDGLVLGTQKGSVHLEVSGLRRTMRAGMPHWSGTIDSVQLYQPNTIGLGKKGARISLAEITGGHIQLPERGSGFHKLWQLPNAWLRSGKGTFRDSNTVAYWEGARYDAAQNLLSLDTLSLQPVPSRDAFIASKTYQADYMTFNSGPLHLSGFDQERLEKEGFLFAHNISVQRPLITIYRDKRPPFQGGIHKPLPTDKIKQLPIALDIGSIQFTNGLVAYTELSEKTNEEGIVTLTNLNATINNIHSRQLTDNDSLYVRMDALLLDSARVNLQFKESYTDSLSGFLMSLRMRPTSLSFLNPVVAPLSSINIVSGTVDSLLLNAIGTEHMALGEMHLFYRDLRIRFVQVGDNNKSQLLLNAKTFLANTFLIHKNNNGRKSLMYFERLRDRSVFNYLVKMTLNGIASGVGVKNNKKMLRQYRKDLDRLQLPQFSNEAKMKALEKEN